MNRGLLLTITEPPPAMEEEFNAWYDDEHLPERLAIPGFISARRWVGEGAAGEGRYLATYELESPQVLKSAPYLARFQNQTPWSRRCLGKALVFKRWACEQRAPGDALPDPATRLVVMIESESPVRLAEALGGCTRHFFAEAAERPHIALVELPDEGLLAQAPGLLRQGRLYRAYR